MVVLEYWARNVLRKWRFGEWWCGQREWEGTSRLGARQPAAGFAHRRYSYRQSWSRGTAPTGTTVHCPPLNCDEVLMYRRAMEPTKSHLSGTGGDFGEGWLYPNLLVSASRCASLPLAHSRLLGFSSLVSTVPS